MSPPPRIRVLPRVLLVLAALFAGSAAAYATFYAHVPPPRLTPFEVPGPPPPAPPIERMATGPRLGPAEFFASQVDPLLDAARGWSPQPVDRNPAPPDLPQGLLAYRGWGISGLPGSPVPGEFVGDVAGLLAALGSAASPRSSHYAGHDPAPEQSVAPPWAPPPAPWTPGPTPYGAPSPPPGGGTSGPGPAPGGYPAPAVVSPVPEPGAALVLALHLLVVAGALRPGRRARR